MPFELSDVEANGDQMGCINLRNNLDESQLKETMD